MLFLVALATAAFGLFTDRSADLLKTTLVTRREHDLKTSLAEGWYRFQLDFAAQQYLHARELAEDAHRRSVEEQAVGQSTSAKSGAAVPENEASSTPAAFDEK